jgi:hypothetical protein
MKQHIIEFMDGTHEIVSKYEALKLSTNQQFLRRMQQNSYGPDTVLATYPIVNIKYWAETDD